MASWWFASDDAEDTFNDVAYAEKHTLDFTAPAEGDYLILVSLKGTNDNTNRSLFYRAQLDDTTTIMEGVMEPNNASQAAEYRNFATMYVAESLAAGSHFVDLDAYIENSGDLGYLKYLKIAVLRLDDWLPTAGMYDYASTEGSTGLTTSFATVETLTFTPDAAGDYLVLASAEVTPASTTVTADVRVNYDAASEYLPVEQDEETTVSYASYEGRDATDYHAWSWGGILSMPEASKTFLLEGKRHGSNGGTVRKRRLFAVRLAAMDASVESTEDAANSSTAAEWADKSTLTFTPGSTEDYLILAGTVIKPNSSSYPGQTRLNQTEGTGSGELAHSANDSKDAGDPACCMPFLTTEIKSLANIQQTFKTQWGYPGSQGTTYCKGSWIVAVRKPAVAGGDIQLLVDGGVQQLIVDGGVIQKIVD